MKEILSSLQRATKMSLLHLEDIGIHFALTPAKWRARFHASAQQVRELGFDQRFVRTWDYYLACYEAAFRERHIGDVQIVMTKNNNARRLAGDPALASPVRTLAGAAR